MTSETRRRELLATAALLPVLAGCLDTFGSADDPGAGAGDDEPNPTGAGESTDGGFDDYETLAFQHHDHREEHEIDLLTDAGDVDDWLAERAGQVGAGADAGDEDADSGDEDADAGDEDADAGDEDADAGDDADDVEPTVRDFLEDTDFESAVVVAIEVGVPDPGYEYELSVDYDADGDELAIDATVEEALDDDEATIQPLTTIGVLVRATAPDAPPSSTTVTVVDADGNDSSAAMGHAEASDEGGAAAGDATDDS